MTYNKAREEEGQEQEDRAKAQTEKLMEDKAGTTATQRIQEKGDGGGMWSHGSYQNWGWFMEDSKDG